jgi:hypothetical protein
MGEERFVLKGLRLRFDADLLEHFRLPFELSLTRGELADAEHIGQDVGILFTCELSRAIRRHGGADSLEEIAYRETVPVGGELASGERWRRFPTAESRSMARRAVVRIESGSTLGLGRGIDTVPYGPGRLCGKDPGR